MTITSVRSSTFIADVVVFLRDKLKANIGDVSSRVYTSYPKINVIYPMITIVDSGSRQEGRLGMSSEGTVLRLGVEIRIWAKNIKQRDEIFDDVYDYLRTNQLSDDNIIGANLHDFSMDSAVNVSEPDVKSKVLEVTYLFVCV